MSKKTILEVPVPGDNHKSNSDSVNTIPRESIGDRAKSMATNSGQSLRDWQSGYTNLVNDVSGFYQEEINNIVRPINEQLSAFLNGLNWDIDHGHSTVIQEVGSGFASIRDDAVQYQSDRMECNGKLIKEQEIFPDLSEDDIRKVEIKTYASWVLFFAILGIVVLFESAANMSLLASALEGGLVKAFLVATLVSVINVVGIGTGIGFFCAFLYRKMRNVFKIVLPIWFGIVMLLNLIIGRHRENFVLDIESKEQAADAAASLSDGLNSLVVIVPNELSEVSFNVASWHFESILFFLLGIILSCFGFYKGFVFHAHGEKLKPILDKLDALKEKIEKGIIEIPKRGIEKLEKLREKVSEKIVHLNNTFNECENKFEDMENTWKGIINVIQTEFVNSYNQANPGERITIQNIQELSVVDGFPATPADRNAIDRGRDAIRNYEKNRQKPFHDGIESAHVEINRLQNEYRQAIHSLMNDLPA